MSFMEVLWTKHPTHNECPGSRLGYLKDELQADVLWISESHPEQVFCEKS